MKDPARAALALTWMFRLVTAFVPGSAYLFARRWRRFFLFWGCVLGVVGLFSLIALVFSRAMSPGAALFIVVFFALVLFGLWFFQIYDGTKEYFSKIFAAMPKDEENRLAARAPTASETRLLTTFRRGDSIKSS